MTPGAGELASVRLSDRVDVRESEHPHQGSGPTGYGCVGLADGKGSAGT